MSRTLANYEQLFTLSQRLNTMSQAVADLRAQGDSVVGSTEWDGHSAQRFREFWSQFATDLSKAQEMLISGSQEVNAKAGLYQQADA